jgi:hypothetical protein
MKVHLVSLPEELPVTESLELHRELKSEFGITAQVYLNKMSGLTEADLHSLSAESKVAMQTLIDSENAAREKFAEAGITVKELPLVPLSKADDIIHSLVKHLDVSNA